MALKALFLFCTLVSLLSCQSSGNHEYKQLFNGENFNGWKPTAGMDSYQIKDGILRVNSTGKGEHLLYVADTFKDFELIVVSKAEPSSNSGIYFHTDGTSRHKNGWLHFGYEVQLNCTEKEKRKTGSLYGVQDLAVSPVDELDWFELKIRVKGKHVQVWADGRKVVDYLEPENVQREQNRVGRFINPEGGFIALQAHDTKSVWYFKEIKIRKL